MIQLKPQKNKEDSLSSEHQVKDVVKQIKSINTKLGYADFVKKISSFQLDQIKGSTSYLVIRNFDDFQAAEAYAKAIAKELPDNIYGEIGDPFPISLHNYQSCVTAKDFKPYFKFYRNNR